MMCFLLYLRKMTVIFQISDRANTRVVTEMQDLILDPEN